MQRIGSHTFAVIVPLKMATDDSSKGKDKNSSGKGKVKEDENEGSVVPKEEKSETPRKKISLYLGPPKQKHKRELSEAMIDSKDELETHMEDEDSDGKTFIFLI